MSGMKGAIELERAVSSIQVGRRHRTDLGDLEPLVTSITREGLLQPITVTPDGLLVCGARRLAAIKQLGWKTVNVWVRSGISDRLGQLLAEQDDNVLHKPLTLLEAAALYRELKEVLAQDAAQRQASTRFSSNHQPGTNGGAHLASPSHGAHGSARKQAAAMVPGGISYTTFDKIGYLERVVADTAQSDELRARAQTELDRINAGGAVDPGYSRIRADVDAQWRERQEELERLAREALERVRDTSRGKRKRPARPLPPKRDPKSQLPTRVFVLIWTDLTNWWERYDIDHLASELTDAEAELFFTALHGSNAFADRLRAAREQPQEAEQKPRHLRAL